MNHTLIRLCAALLLLGLGLFWQKPAHATLSCSVVAPSPINFPVDPLATQTDVTGNLTVTCTNTGGFLAIAASARICFEVDNATSDMRKGNSRLTYELFQNAAYSLPWTNDFSTNPQPTVSFNFGNGSTQILVPFNARVLAGQNPVPGTYQDNYPAGQTQMTVNVAYGLFAAPPPPATCAGSNSQHFGFQAIATVDPKCNVNASTLDFGTPAGLLTTAVPGTSSIDVQCSVGTAYNVGLDGGKWSGSNINARKMQLGLTGNFVAYQLYQDPGRTLVWGNTPGTDTIPGTGDGASHDLMVYGQVPAQTTPPAGTYQDVVIVSVTY
jgi:spore coat protein U-like protein